MGKQKGKRKADERQAKGRQRANKGQAKGNNVTKKQCNKETSGGVCALQAHTHHHIKKKKDGSSVRHALLVRNGRAVFLIRFFNT